MNTNKFICHGCVAEPYLQRQIRNLGVESECSYCLARAPAYSLGQMADRMETAFEQHCQCTPPTRDTFSHPYLRPRAGTRALNAIADAAGLPCPAGEDIRKLLEARCYDDDTFRTDRATECSAEAHYARKSVDPTGYRQQWLAFEDAIKAGTAESADAWKTLDRVFCDIAELSTDDAGPPINRVDLGSMNIHQVLEVNVSTRTHACSHPRDHRTTLFFRPLHY